ncbi:hypothetical protein [Nostoc sp. UHCC 0252]|uniref:hypothetical protein n=1 Tax=Nostoc sp. UHCC 0252 TaxID=3110241 RepID=UPI002B213E12|nr:hypothetical protein [Nostoc sp. UHCC 0252]MEA5603246.1 hypothetical protein [Nostoc sp. UHCC 0252]
MRADAGDLRSHQSRVVQWAGGIGAEVFGVVGEAESSLSYCCGREVVSTVGV